MRDDLHISLGLRRARYRARGLMKSWVQYQQWSRRQKGRCAACGANEHGPMLIADVWERIAPRDVCLCTNCIRRRLGRPITPRDLRDCGYNGRWKWASAYLWRAWLASFGVRWIVIANSLPREEDVETSDIPEAGEEFFKKAKLVTPGETR